jgi:hypothetical protein
MPRHNWVATLPISGMPLMICFIRVPATARKADAVTAPAKAE